VPFPDLFGSPLHARFDQPHASSDGGVLGAHLHAGVIQLPPVGGARRDSAAANLLSRRSSKLYGVGRATVLPDSVTAPIRASALPFSVAPVFRVID
jgi:hypothetical protein